jgi:hypothetical protein
MGTSALASNTTGYQNTATGLAALSSNTTGYYDTSSGYCALGLNSAASQNTADGYEAPYSNVGDFAGDGWYNTAVGYQALYTNNDTSGTGGYAFQNVALGNQALYQNATGNHRRASGFQALYNNTTGGNNTAVGFFCARRQLRGQRPHLHRSICNVSGDDLANATAIGAHATVGAGNSLVLGGTGPYAVKVGIGATTPSNVLTIAQGAGHPVSDSWQPTVRAAGRPTSSHATTPSKESRSCAAFPTTGKKLASTKSE